MKREELAALAAGAASGDALAVERLSSLLYDELRALAERYMRRERSNHTLQPTALVHEAYLRLIGTGIAFQNRAHFLALAARTMRRVLLDHARRRAATKRGGGVERVTLADVAAADSRTLDLIAVDAALERLAQIEPRQAQVVELRFFGGLEIEEAAEVLGVSKATVKRDWRFARAWLAGELHGGGDTQS